MTEILRFRVTPALYRKLVNLAKWDKRDLPDYVRILIEDAVKAKEKSCQTN